MSVSSTRPVGPPPDRSGYSWDPVVVADFDATSAHPGLSVEFTAPSIGEWMAILRDDNGATEDSDGLFATLEQRTFAQCLVGWNLIYPKGHPWAGEAVPATLAGYLSLPRRLARPIIREWVERTINLSGPLDGSSASGVTSALLELNPLPIEGSSEAGQQDGSTP